MSIPIELSLDNYQTAFTGLRNVGMICRTKSSPVSILGSTIGAAGNDLMFLDDDGQRRMLPRINSKCRQDMDGFNTLQKKWVVNITNQSDTITHEYASKHDSHLLELLEEAKRIIPPELRISGSCFTGIALVGSCNADLGKVESRHNHPHKESNYVISLFSLQ